MELCLELILLGSKNPLELLELLDVVLLLPLLADGRISLGGLKSAKTLLLTSFNLLLDCSFSLLDSAIRVMISSHFPLGFSLCCFSDDLTLLSFSAKISFNLEPTLVLGIMGVSANNSALFEAMPFS